MSINNSITNMIKNMPKLDLHCHLDGSLSTQFVKLASGITLDNDELSKKLQAPPDCSSLAEYLTCFDLPISCLQTKQNITDSVIDVLKQAAAENVTYIELRFAPTCSLNNELSYTEIYEAAIEGSNLGLKKYNIHSNIIACAMRHHDIKTNMEVLKSSREFLGHGVCAIDLAGDEASFNNALFIDLFTEAKRLEMPFTIHSGECGSSDNVRLALEFGASRVGHGIALIKDFELMQECKKQRLGIELCPTSNYQTRAVMPGDTYPLNKFLENGIMATINTDNRTVSNTTSCNELEFIVEHFGINEEDLITLYKNSVEISFANDNLKNDLLKMV